MDNFNKIISRVIGIVKKTGDKIVVTDQNGDSGLLIMPLSEYEKIVEDKSDLTNLTESELLDKINRDIALWKESQRSEYGLDWQGGPEFFKPEDLHDKNQGSKLEKGDSQEESQKGSEDKKQESAKYEPIKYEDVPPPPELSNTSQLQVEQDEEPVIDLSFEDEAKFINETSNKSDDFSEEEFKEEPVG